jgi:hypothetical protein
MVFDNSALFDTWFAGDVRPANTMAAIFSPLGRSLLEIQWPILFLFYTFDGGVLGRGV